MNEDLATHISLLAAPIYAMLIAEHRAVEKVSITPEVLNVLRSHAITQAQALWLQTLAT